MRTSIPAGSIAATVVVASLTAVLALSPAAVPSGAPWAPATALDASAASQPDDPSIGDTTVFAKVPDPGFPEGIAVDGDAVYVTGPASPAGAFLGAGGASSRIWVFDRSTSALETILDLGSAESGEHGLANLALDSDGRLYVAAIEPGLGILRVDPATGAVGQYAAIPDIPPCGPLPPAEPTCSPTLLDRPPLANDLVFDAEGNLYVTDSTQATVWRIPPGGAAEAWFQHVAFDQAVGPNGIRLGPAGETLYVAVITSNFNPTHPSAIYTVPRVEDPAPGDLEVFAEVGGVDGIAFGESGRLYAAAANDHQIVVLAPDGTELHRFPDPVDNLQRDVPYDAPATLAFNDTARTLYVTNHAFFDGVAFSDRFAVLEAYVDDTALPLERPAIP